MDRDRFQELIKTFFVCDKGQIAEIFHEFLTAMEAEELLSPGGLMSRNYETAQANPEIHTLPGNLKDARDSVFPYFWGTDGWYSGLHLENVKGPANFASLIGVLACLLKNPNLCVDKYSLRSNELEVKAITALANLVFYHTESPWGVFTMGGTISNLYGGKLGIEKVVPGAMQSGLHGQSVAGIVSDAAHYSNKTLAGWLGIGTDNLVSVPTTPSLSMDLNELRLQLHSLYQRGFAVAFVIATFGSTDAFGVDDVEGIRDIIDELAREYQRPVPQLHVDAAVGWVFSVLNEYDTEQNRFQLWPETLRQIEEAKKLAQKIKFADSVTIDFHKMGWGHYPSSAFIVNRRDDLARLDRAKEQVPYFCEADYRHDPALFTLECSRPAIGPYSVMASLNGIGLIGYQMLTANAMQLATLLKQEIETLEYCKVLNLDTIGPSVVWWVLPKGRDAKEIFRRLMAGELTELQLQRYREEVRRLFDKREATLDRSIDARLSFTTDMGFRPYGHELPAWKGVFFNPKTDESVINQIVTSIKNLA